jgi:phenylacetate-CoA ligase
MSKAIEWLVRNVTYPMWLARNGNWNTLRYIRHYRSPEWCASEANLKQSQLAGLKRILVHASEQTGYYRELFDAAGFDPAGFNDPAQLQQLPILDKDAIRDNLEGMLARNIGRERLEKTSTGGSTGTPLVFYRDRECLDRRKAQELFFDRWIGCEIGHKVALFVARVHTPPGVLGLKARLRNATSARLLAFDPYDTSKARMEEFYRRFRAFQPRIVKCFPNSLVVFARFLKDRGYDPGCIDAVSCTGENLYDHQRQLFEEVFRCPVFEKYGTFEHGVISCECSQHNGQHIFTDGVYVELLDGGRPVGPGEVGDIVVTDLFNYGMPFIRYRIGDKGVMSDRQCPCGSKLPLLENLLGRDRDLLLAGNGDLKPGYLFVEIFNKNHIPGKFQVIQRRPQRVEVKVVPEERFGEEHVKVIHENFAKLLGSEVEVVLEYVDEIPREPSGKYAYVKGECA